MMHDVRGRWSGDLSIVYAALRAALALCLTLLVRTPIARAQPFAIQFRISQQISVAVGAFDPDTSTGPGPNALTMADVDNDGNLDIVAIDQDDDAIWVLYGHGDGTFDVPQNPIDLSVTPNAVAVADISSPEGSPDGKPDIIVASDGGDVAEILLATGNRTFSSDAAQDLTDLIDDSDRTEDLVVGNFDAGPETDVAFLDVSDAGDARVLFLCNTSGNLTLCGDGTHYNIPVNGQTPVDIGLGDFDHDSHADVVVLSQDTKRYSVIYGDGSGNFTSAGSSDARADTTSDENVPFALAVGKMDGSDDQFDDIVISTAESFSDVSTLVVHSEGGRRFSRITATGPFASATSISLGDIDGDRLIDAGIGVIAPSGETSLNRPEILVGDGAGGFQGSLANIKVVGGTMGEGQAIAVRDVDKDNLADLVQINKAGDMIVVAINISDQAPVPTDTPTRPVPTSPGATRTVTPTRPTSTAASSATVTATPTPGVPSYGLCVVANFQPTPIPSGTPATPSGGTGDKAGSFAGVAIGNLDGGGGDDIALCDDKNDLIYVIPNTAELRTAIDECSGQLHQRIEKLNQKEIDLPAGQKPGAIVAVDLDGNADLDSQQDLVVIGTDRVLVYWNAGGAAFGTPVVLGPFNARPSAIVADAPDPRPGSVGRVPLDLDGDGSPDVVVALPNENQLRIFYGQPGLAHTFVEGTRPAAIPEPAVALASGDFDGGFPDLVVATTRRVLLLHQDGRDTQRSHFVGQEALFDGPASAVTSAFFDNNQVADVLLGRKSGSGGIVEVHLAAASETSASFATSGEPIGAAVGAFNVADMTSDVAVLTDLPIGATAVTYTENAVTFGLGNGAGGLPTVLQPFTILARPRALAEGLIDSDLVHDVVTANENGTFTILLSGSAPATPIPTTTLSPTPTPTASPTQTVSSPTATATAIGSFTSTPLQTSTPSAVPTPKGGAFSLSSCAINDQASDWPMHALVVLGALATIRGRRRGAMRVLLLLVTILIPLRSSKVHAENVGITGDGDAGDTPTAIETSAETTPAGSETETATTATGTVTGTPTHTPTVMLGWCTVSQAGLGNPGGALVGGVAVPLDDQGGVDLALLYDNDVAIQRIDIAALRARACSRIAAASLQAITKGKGLTAAELDGDRLIDLIVTEQNTDVATFHNGGDGTLTILGTRPVTQPGAVAIGNLDDDAIEDLAIGSGQNVAILKGTGNGKYNAPVPLDALTPESVIKRVIVADVNLDGLDDIVAVNQNGALGVFVQGTGTPRFSLQPVRQIEAPEDLIVADINPQDPRGQAPDILYVTSSGLHVMLGSISGTTVTFGTPSDYPVPNGGTPSEPSAVAVGRFDTDNNLDVAVADAANNVVHFFMGDGRGVLDELPVENNQATGPAPRGLLVADFDGDQKDDLVSLNRGDGSITIFLSTASTPTPTPTSTPIVDTRTATLPPSPTPTSTPVSTPTSTPPSTGTAVLTVTPTFSGTPTHTFGAFDVQGTCAVGYPTGLSDAMPLVVLASLALLRRRAKS